MGDPRFGWADGGYAVGAVTNKAAEDLAATWFKHECVLIQGAGESPYGDPVPGVEVPFGGFVRQSTQRVVSPTGEELVTTTTVSCPLRLEAEIGDHVRLPAPFAGTWEITQRSAHEGAGNLTPDHQKLYLTVAAGA